MNEPENRDRDIVIDVEGSEDSMGALDASDTEAGPSRCTASFRPLVHFIKYNLHHVPMDSGPILEYDCPVCRETTAESGERMLQVDLSTCNHVFGADCFERYIQRSNTCPLCREMWFEKRLTEIAPNSAARIGQIVIQVSVADDQSADALLDAIQNDGGETIDRLLSERITEVSDSEDDTEFQPSVTGDASDTSGEQSASSSVSNNIEATRIEVTFGAGAETQSDGETDGEVFVADRRACGERSRSTSENEAAVPPRRRRRYE